MLGSGWLASPLYNLELKDDDRKTYIRGLLPGRNINHSASITYIVIKLKRNKCVSTKPKIAHTNPLINSAGRRRVKHIYDLCNRVIEKVETRFFPSR